MHHYFKNLLRSTLHRHCIFALLFMSSLLTKLKDDDDSDYLSWMSICIYLLYESYTKYKNREKRKRDRQTDRQPNASMYDKYQSCDVLVY